MMDLVLKRKLSKGIAILLGSAFLFKELVLLLNHLNRRTTLQEPMRYIVTVLKIHQRWKWSISYCIVSTGQFIPSYSYSCEDNDVAELGCSAPVSFFQNYFFIADES
jgi:hypothetical protein